jgi:hypothetical protein
MSEPLTAGDIPGMATVAKIGPAAPAPRSRRCGDTLHGSLSDARRIVARGIASPSFKDGERSKYLGHLPAAFSSHSAPDIARLVELTEELALLDAMTVDLLERAKGARRITAGMRKELRRPRGSARTPRGCRKPAPDGRARPRRTIRVCAIREGVLAADARASPDIDARSDNPAGADDEDSRGRAAASSPSASCEDDPLVH